MNYPIPYTNYRITWPSLIGTTILLALIIFCLILFFLPVWGLAPLLMMPFIGIVLGNIVAAFIMNSQKENANQAFMISLAKILVVIALTAFVGLAVTYLTSIITWGSHIHDVILGTILIGEIYSIFLSLATVMNLTNAENFKKFSGYKALSLILAIILIGIGLGIFYLLTFNLFTVTVMCSLLLLATISIIAGGYLAIGGIMHLDGKEKIKEILFKAALVFGFALIGIAIGIAIGFVLSFTAVAIPTTIIGFTINPAAAAFLTVTSYGLTALLAVFNKAVYKKLFSSENLPIVTVNNESLDSKTPETTCTTSASPQLANTDDNQEEMASSPAPESWLGWLNWLCS